jgi:hypothetical protein
LDGFDGHRRGARRIGGELVRKGLVLVAGAVVFGGLVLAAPASACDDVVVISPTPVPVDLSSPGGPTAFGSPGSIGVPVSVEP